MHRILVWDLPTRLLHWLLTATVVGATALAMAGHGRGLAFQLHMLLGLVALAVVVLRLLWGFAGTRYAQFRSFLFGPTALARYLAATIRGRGEPHVGHNPGSSYAAYAMLLAPVVLGISGLFAARGAEVGEHIHEPVSHLLVLILLAHIAGIAWHTFRHRENVARSMIDGRKKGAPADAIASSRPLAGLVFVLLCAAWAGLLWSGLDPSTGAIVLPVGGVSIVGARGSGELREQSGDHERGSREDDHDSGDHER
jgi:cytochrome b